MFYEISDFPFLQPFINNSEAIFNELLNFQDKLPIQKSKSIVVEPAIDYITEQWVIEGGFHSEQIGYDSRGGMWTSLPIYYKNELAYNSKRKKMFPKTYSLLEEVPHLNFASFFRTKSGCHIKSHKHILKNLIFHVLLQDVGEGCSFLCNGKTRHMSDRGDYVIFDYSYDHSSMNNSPNDRTNFAIDFTPIKKSKNTNFAKRIGSSVLSIFKD